jgi:hypothetical protein
MHLQVKEKKDYHRHGTASTHPKCATLFDPPLASHKEGKEKERKRIALFAACGRSQG